MAQWKRAGPITQRSVDRNYALLVDFFNFVHSDWICQSGALRCCLLAALVPLAQRIARWTSNPKVLGSTPRWDDRFLHFVQFFYLGIIDQLSEVYGFHSVAVITCASHAQGRRFEPGWKHQNFASSTTLIYHTHGGQAHKEVRSYGVMVSTLDFESSDPSSNLGRT